MIADIKDSVDANGRLIYQQPNYNKTINSDIALQLDEKFVTSRVKRRAVGPKGKVVRRYYSKPMMNHMIYEVGFTDIQEKYYAADIIAKNMLSQVDNK